MPHPKRPTASPAPLLPGAYVHLILEAAKSTGVTQEQVLSGSGLPRDKLEQPYWYVDFQALDALLLRAIRLTNDPLLPLKIGQTMKVTNHGVIGLAAMVAPTLGEALDMCCGLLQEQCQGLRFSLSQSARAAMFRLEITHAHHPLSAASLTVLMTGLARMACELTGRSLPAEADVTFDKPAYFSQLPASLASMRVRFNQQHNQWRFPKEALQWPLVHADPVAARLLRAQCKKLIQAHQEKPNSTAQMVRRLMAEDHEGTHSMDRVASKLNMSIRTMQRQLVREGVTYSELVEQLKCQRAEVMLKTQDAALAAIADSLGYANPANFNRAFRRWYGMSPSHFRRQYQR